MFQQSLCLSITFHKAATGLPSNKAPTCRIFDARLFLCEHLQLGRAFEELQPHWHAHLAAVQTD
jgi:hypothetical protein